MKLSIFADGIICHMENPKEFTKSKQQTEKRRVEFPEGEIGERGRMKSEVGINRNTLMYQKGFINDDTPDSTRNITQYFSIT